MTQLGMVKFPHATPPWTFSFAGKVCSLILALGAGTVAHGLCLALVLLPGVRHDGCMARKRCGGCLCQT